MESIIFVLTEQIVLFNNHSVLRGQLKKDIRKSFSNTRTETLRIVLEVFIEIKSLWGIHRGNLATSATN